MTFRRPGEDTDFIHCLSTDVVVIGAGVVGLAVARAFALKGWETIVLERAEAIGTETSSRSSEVIHAGIYYRHGSLKAQLCVRGRTLLYRYLQEHALPHARCGKLIVAASDDDKNRLELIASRAQKCGVSDLRWLAREEISDLEPAVQASFGLYSPSTGIVDSHQLMLSLQGQLEHCGGAIAFGSEVVGGRLDPVAEHELQVAGPEPVKLRCRTLVNACGLNARTTLQLLGSGDRGISPPPQFFAKGQYYSYSGTAPFARLVYPLPESGGLGVHATLDLAGQVRFGPDVKWVDSLDYTFDDSRRPQFLQAIRRYYPALEARRLQPGYTGIRPKISGPGTPDSDFLIMSPADHGYPGFYSLHGIESPGLTAALAIAELISEM